MSLPTTFNEYAIHSAFGIVTPICLEIIDSAPKDGLLFPGSGDFTQITIGIAAALVPLAYSWVHSNLPFQEEREKDSSFTADMSIVASRSVPYILPAIAINIVINAITGNREISGLPLASILIGYTLCILAVTGMLRISNPK